MTPRPFNSPDFWVISCPGLPRRSPSRAAMLPADGHASGDIAGFNANLAIFCGSSIVPYQMAVLAATCRYLRWEARQGYPAARIRNTA
jgi:hypothetical protein